MCHSVPTLPLPTILHLSRPAVSPIIHRLKAFNFLFGDEEDLYDLAEKVEQMEAMMQMAQPGPGKGVPAADSKAEYIRAPQKGYYASVRAHHDPEILNHITGMTTFDAVLDLCCSAIEEPLQRYSMCGSSSDASRPDR